MARGLALGLALGPGAGVMLGCGEPEPPRLVAVPGCGIGADLIDNLRVKARGDFPEGGGTEVVFSSGSSTLEWGDRPVAGVTVEGLFGSAVEAVGRTARLRPEGELPVYFARVDGLCPVGSDRGEVTPRESVAAAVGPEGDVIIAGGRAEQGVLLNEVLHLRDEDGQLTALAGSLPRAAVGQTVHALGERRFVVMGGASFGSGGRVSVDDEAVLIDLDDDPPIGGPVTVRDSDEVDGPARAFHAGARDAQGRILLVGGCRRVTSQLECMLDSEDPIGGDPHEQPSVLASSVWVESDGATVDLRPAPPLIGPRYGATLLFARDGVAFVAGGYDEFGAPVHRVERNRPGAPRFLRYGGGLGDAVSPDLPVVGATLLEGGMVVLAFADGRIHFLTEEEREEYEPWSNWCGGEEGDPCFADMPGEFMAMHRGVVSLPGERVLIDGVMLPVNGLEVDATDVRDLFVAGLAGPGAPVPPARRVGTEALVVDDGTVLLVGGRDPVTRALATPPVLRLRPGLDGPDERIPALGSSAAGNLMVHAPGRVERPTEPLRFVGSDEEEPSFPRVRVHARGFRSASFRFEVTVEVVSGDIVPTIVLQHGAVEAFSVSLERSRVQAHFRDPQARVVDLSCSSNGLSFGPEDGGGAQALRVDVSASSIRVDSGGETIAQCPGLSGARPWSVGIGGAGPGEMVVSGLRLSRR